MSESKSLFGDCHEMAHIWARIKSLKSVQSALNDLKRPPERLQSQCNYRLFIT